MRITSISYQVRDQNRVNIGIDGKFRFSLDINQLIEFGLKKDQELTEAELAELELASKFGKLYLRARDYCLMRPRSVRELNDYLYRKTSSKINKKGEREVLYPRDLSPLVIEKLIEKKFLDDFKFADYWINNRNLSKGISRRKLTNELISKGIDRKIIDELLRNSERSDDSELIKIINKKRARYGDDKKFANYLIRLGFNYDDIKKSLAVNEDQDFFS